MSNSPSSRVVMRVQPSAIVFVVLVLVIGALIMMSSSIDPKSGVRPQPSQTSVNSWAYGKFVAWKSPDNLIELEHPDTWLAQASAQERGTYIISSPASQDSGITIQAGTVSDLGIPNLPTNATTADMLKAILPQTQTNAQVQSASASGLNGNRVHFTVNAQDPNRGPVSIDRELWFLPLDAQHLLIVFAQSTTADWPKMQPIFEQVTRSLKVDAAGIIRTIDAARAPAATGAATAPAAPAATQAATAAQ
ncbi:MAG: hypothetical protein IT324_22115 [Anaerolineae bacterium]|nr:hypothetical protein [Anaerolineae bacterium]